MILMGVLIGLLTIGIVILIIRELSRHARQAAATQEKQRMVAQETKPPEPVLQMRSNADGQFSIFYDPPAEKGILAATFYTPYTLGRESSRNLALDILRHQGADGISAAQTFLEEQNEK